MTDLELRQMRESLFKRFVDGEIDAATYERMRGELEHLSRFGTPEGQETPAPSLRDTPPGQRPGEQHYQSVGDWETSAGMAPKADVGGFRLETMIGRGGMGEVWKAYDPTADRFVVIKLVPPELQKVSDEMGRVKETFSRIHSLQHQHICPVYLLGQAPQYGYFVVMKYIAGQSLAAYRNTYVARYGKFPLSQLLKVLASVASALDYAHQQRVIHRDIKPENILVVGNADDVQVVDFGLAAEIRTSVSRVSRVQMETSGTYPYMAPEQWRGEFQDAATDQYALGVVAYELLAGRLPFDTPDVTTMRLCVLNDMPSPLADQPEHVNRALARAMAKRREDRFASCEEFVAALKTPQEFAELHEIEERPAPPPPPPVAYPPVQPALHGQQGYGQPGHGQPPSRPQSGPRPPQPSTIGPTLTDVYIQDHAAAEGRAWYAAAQGGDPQSQYRVAMCFFHGWAVPANPREGVKWLLFSAQQGCREAQFRLGMCYEQGLGIRRSLIEAARWHRKAGGQGIAEATRRFDGLPFWATLLQKLGLDP